MEENQAPPAVKKARNKIFAVIPHAADGALTLGATLLKYAKNDWRVIVCVATSENREIEKKELLQSGKLLGVSQAYFLKYKTGSLKQAGLDNPKEDILQIITEEKPNIILTVARHGFSTNPDATTTSLAATLAYEKYAQYVNFVIPAQAEIQLLIPKLYYFCLPEHFLSFVQSKGFLRKDSAGFNFEGAPDKKINHVIDVKNFVKQKIEALRVHKSAQTETSRMIELLKTYKSARMDYYMKYSSEETNIIANRL